MNRTHSKMTFRFGDSGTTAGREQNEQNERDGRRQSDLEQTGYAIDTIAEVEGALPDGPEVEEAAETHGHPHPVREDEPAILGGGDEDEIHRIESFIRESDKQSAQRYPLPVSIADPAGEPMSEQGEWAWNGVHTRTRKPSLWKVIASVAGALATGAVFGFIALSLFKGEVRLPDPTAGLPNLSGQAEQTSDGGKVVQTASDKQPADSAAIPATAQPTGKGDKSEAAWQATGVYVTDVNIPEKTFYMLQYGVFDKPEGAKTAIGELRDKGMAAMEEQAGQHRVYAAIASAREDAMSLSQLLKNRQIDMYVREMSRPALTQLAFQGNAADVEQFMEDSDAVISWLTAQSVAHLEGTESAAFAVEDTEQLRKQHLQWTQHMSKVQKGQPKQSADAWTKLVQAMNTAISAVNEYNKQPSASHLWSIQQAVMQYLSAERSWLDTMKA
ncbi:SPOR domain-containing protein [Paenibacillus thiaminolyticus]|uniref:SPOR domain-containing protein n=1 Tax=Paenibacillus thiaminolyticus TaxID=49283 RepID=A0AAP9J348_PANTH|nr:SPOR domain-containing protein [Paenibacillus thiaminolyticus]MCY9535676.1 SPOR domain-containing protein [Paenibacillus thiaminolyticus]MCY9600018.1 SPOR domain-containing protein [Paenibacillus thiaminolyticus]MCY9610476.1 SPOR domain-containing protein [Paenibacillus thiaminolyticus]MCY9615707.1 SPOR domain-containing protein [Paenibacillus thiaminolyticus]MCY9617071.1 SPOR domain-containing protein [Paenibacillus thiaminolyticus]